MSNIQIGQRVRIIGDTFSPDPHGLELGAVYTVESISPATPYSEFPPFVQFLYAMEGQAPFDLPERVHVRFGDGEFDFANVTVEDIEAVESTLIRMTDYDLADGYEEGDVFEVVIEDGTFGFYDADGDFRHLDIHPHEFI